jgi:hypothetical protein
MIANRMDRPSARLLLKQAEQSMLEADFDVARQREVVRELHSKGADASDAEARLDELQKIQARRLFNRNRLLAELGDDAKGGW